MAKIEISYLSSIGNKPIITCAQDAYLENPQDLTIQIRFQLTRKEAGNQYYS